MDDVPAPRSSLPRPRRVAGWATALLPLVVGLGLRGFADADDLALAALTLLASAVVVALIGGLAPALVAAVVGFVALNLWFTRPVGTLDVAEPRNVIVLVVFLGVAAGVATVVDRASRQAIEAARARRESDVLAGLSRSVLTGHDTAEAIVQRLSETYAATDAALRERVMSAPVAGAAIGDTTWQVVAGALPGAVGDDDLRVAIDADHELVLRDVRLGRAEERVLSAFAVQAGLVLEYRRLRERDERAAVLERAEATSTALLRAVSHDLRTPLATLRAAVDGLLVTALPAPDRGELVAAAASSVEHLERLIDNLLDLSRIRNDLVRPTLRALALDEVLPLAVAGHPSGAVVLEAAETAPLVLTDAGLLERVVANLVGNAVRVSAGRAVRVRALPSPESVAVAVVDQGPGVPVADRARMFEPFQRLDDTSPGGLGLGLAVASGLAAAIGARLRAEDTPGGGLTMVVSLPRAGR